MVRYLTTDDADALLQYAHEHKDDFTVALRTNYAQSPDNSPHELVVEIYRAGSTSLTRNDTQAGDYLFSLYSRRDVEQALADHQLDPIVWPEEPEPVAEPEPSYWIAGAELGRFCELLREGVVQYNRYGRAFDGGNSTIIEYCCGLDGGHFYLYVTDFRGNHHRLETREEAEQLIAAQRAESANNKDEYERTRIRPAHAEYDNMTGYFKVIADETGAPLSSDVAPYDLWTLDELRQCHGLIQNTSTQHRYRVSPPENLFDSVFDED